VLAVATDVSKAHLEGSIPGSSTPRAIVLHICQSHGPCVPTRRPCGKLPSKRCRPGCPPHKSPSMCFTPLLQTNFIFSPTREGKRGCAHVWKTSSMNTIRPRKGPNSRTLYIPLPYHGLSAQLRERRQAVDTQPSAAPAPTLNAVRTSIPTERVRDCDMPVSNRRRYWFQLANPRGLRSQPTYRKSDV
jgi:hypothetical protein